ncbi:glycerophosphoryl diester phosphodiesterase membrane domain-containing protein [Curtobacterium sp. MCJR17_020]|uniref:glycerophosphoryl diester phosphodiesterase membrane domain-containing protein n=1 Tax=Curtobacterium sp. MCJR17_020 TaxID=2175619 RepID=UPI000DAA6F6B|nr:glycerophosphoryl diester phosphodiesterase membrane domain-containing protein [Curtobacterium sp. MCJR17_020]WIE70910.1 glycerophosphoryl diester phosphodiesterase membrane domain-containing protein [Curtobacterium sp. MCJR17_020]
MSDWQTPGGGQQGAGQQGAGQQGAWQGQPGGPPRFSAPPPPTPGPGRPPGGRPPSGSRPVIPLRPLGFGDVLGGAFTVFRRNARVLLLWSVLLSGVLGLLSTLVSTFGQQALQSRMMTAFDGSGGGDTIVAGSVTLWILLTIGLPFLAYLGRGFLVAPVAADTGQRVLGRRATFRGLWALLAGRRWPVVAWMFVQIGAGLVVGIIVAVVFVAFFAALGAGDASAGWFVLAVFVMVLGLGVVLTWLGIRFAFTVPTIALEGRPVFAAAAQSWRLTRGAFWRTFGVLLLVQVMFGVAASIASAPLTIGAVLVGGVFDPLGQTDASSGIGAGALVLIVIGSLLAIAVQCVTDVLSAAVVTFLTIDRRIRTEALDQRIASHLDTGEPADPFAPSAPVSRPPWPPQQWAGQQQPWAQQQPQQWPGQPPQAWPGQQQAQQPWPGQQQPWPQHPQHPPQQGQHRPPDGTA